MNNHTPFDPWDWLGVCTGGFNSQIDYDVLDLLHNIRDNDFHGTTEYAFLLCTLLCNTDAFEFDELPTQLRFVGDERFAKLDSLIDAWDDWIDRRYWKER